MLNGNSHSRCQSDNSNLLFQPVLEVTNQENLGLAAAIKLEVFTMKQKKAKSISLTKNQGRVKSIRTKLQHTMVVTYIELQAIK